MPSSQPVRSNGGYILGSAYHSHEYAPGTFVNLTRGHVPADLGVFAFLLQLCRENHTIYDLGAGVGQYELLIRRHNCSTPYNSYDGSVESETFTGGLVKHLDLTSVPTPPDSPRRLPPRAWTVSLEVGEHIPRKYETQYIQNLHTSNTHGIVLSWSNSRYGQHHVNPRNASYVLQTFAALGYVYDEATSRRVRKAATYPWFRRGLLVLNRSRPVVAVPA